MKRRLVKIIRILLVGAVFFFAVPIIFVFAKEINIAVIDSGAKGYVDSARSFTPLSAQEDLLNHGTQVAKLIRRQNSGAKIHMLQVCDRVDGILKPSREAVLNAIEWSVANRMDIVNLSLVIKYDSQIEEAIQEAARKYGIVFVAAGGNRTLGSHFATDDHGYIIRKTSLSVKPVFPASSPHVISVGALEPNGKIARYSDKTCDVYENGKVLGQEGTSFACARITAKIARILSMHPLRDKTMILTHLKNLDS